MRYLKFKVASLKAVFVAIAWIVSSHTALAQSFALKLSKSSIDFGRIASIAYPAKTIEFVNAGKDKLAILLVSKGTNVKVYFERRFFQPGEKGIISVYYEVSALGDFTEAMSIYTNLDTDPVVVTLKGTCISVQECFPNMNNLVMRNIVVINKITQAPVPNAVLSLVHNHNVRKPMEFKMDKNGKAIQEMPIGLYNVTTNVQGFETYDGEFFVPKTQPNVVIELTPKQPAPVAAPINVPVNTAVAPATTIPIVTSADLPEDKYSANNIVFLLDVSSSMNTKGKFTLLQQSINNLVMILRPIDYVSIITYATEAKVVLPSLSGSEKDKIITTVQELIAKGTTQGAKGLNTAYDMATRQFIKDGNNQVILATDGEFSERNLTDDYYQQFISGYAKNGIRLSILGFGVNQYSLERMKKMANSGNGSYIHIESEQFVKNMLIDEIKAKSFISGSR